MKVKQTSKSTKIVRYETKRLQVGPYRVLEQYINGKLADQIWSVKGGWATTHPTIYEPKHASFHYYEDVSFLQSDECFNLTTIYDKLPESSIVDNWDSFKGFSHVLCIHLGYDGNIYQIDKPDPLPLWRRKNYISSFTNRDYDLEKVVKALKKYKWIRNVEIVDIPYYNAECGKNKAVEFEYKLSSRPALGEKLGKNPLFKEHYFGTL